MSQSQYDEKRAIISLPLSVDALTAAEKAVVDPKHDFHSLFDECGYMGIIHFAHQLAGDFKHKLGKDTIKKWCEVCFPLLASVPRGLLRALYADGLCPNIAGDRDLKELYDSGSPWVELKNDPFAPCIYVRELDNDDLDPPTISQLIEVVDSLRNYLSGDDKFAGWNSRIENQTRGVQTDRVNQGGPVPLPGRFREAGGQALDVLHGPEEDAVGD
jgi:hypothetical protein